MVIDEMWELFNNFTVSDGKICVPLSGGLDSRVLAGIISKRRPIDLGFHFYTDQGFYNHDVIHRLLEHLDYTNFECINIHTHTKINFGEIGDLNAAARTLFMFHDLKKYTVTMPIQMDILTGRDLTKRYNRKHFYEMINDRDMNLVYFGAKSYPLWNPVLVAYLQSLSRYDRFFQRAYRKMIRKYLPELWEIPRAFETGPPVSLNYYIPKRIYSKLLGK